MRISWAVPGHTARAGDSPTLPAGSLRGAGSSPGAHSVVPAPPPQPAARAQRPPVPQPAKSHFLSRFQRPPGWSPRSPLFSLQTPSSPPGAPCVRAPFSVSFIHSLFSISLPTSCRLWPLTPSRLLPSSLGYSEVLSPSPQLHLPFPLHVSALPLPSLQCAPSFPVPSRWTPPSKLRTQYSNRPATAPRPSTVLAFLLS